VKTLLFLPLAFLAGMDGFALFAPYLAVVITLVALFSRPRVARPPAHRSLHDLERPPQSEQSFL